jgi:hypothetical protein
MKTNHANTADIASNMEKATMQMQPIFKLANTKPLPCSAQEMHDYVGHLMASDEECLRTYQEQEVCDRATD